MRPPARPGFKECVEGTSVCLKVYKKQSEQAVHRELMALYRLSDPEEENCVVQLLGYNLTQTPYFLVMRPAGGASPRWLYAAVPPSTS